MNDAAFGRPLRIRLAVAGVSLLLLFGVWRVAQAPLAMATLPTCRLNGKSCAGERSYSIPTHTHLGLPANWGNLPSPDVLVRLNTPQGSFLLPMGYLTYWWMFVKEPVITAPDGTRVFDGGPSFQFEFPSGKISLNANWITAVPDENSWPLPDRSVVWIMGVRPPEPRMSHPEIDALNLYAPGQLHLEPLIGNPKTDPVYRGVVAGAEPGHRIGVVMSCDVHCLFDLYLERRNLVVHGYLDGRFRNQVLAVADKVQTFYDGWHEAYP